MHLRSIPAEVKKDALIYRKDVIGKPGFIYGAPEKIHVEIICDDTNLEHLIGRKTGDLDKTKEGRSDTVYGEMYFRLNDAKVYLNKPDANIVNPPGEMNGSPNVIGKLKNVYVGLRYAAGDGPLAQRGSAYGH